MANWAGRENLQLAVALFAEFIGTMLFQYFGGSPMDIKVVNAGVQITPPPLRGLNGDAAGVINGLLLMVIVWMTAEWSGGHVNPAVTLGLLISGNVRARSTLLTNP